MGLAVSKLQSTGATTNAEDRITANDLEWIGHQTEILLNGIKIIPCLPPFAISGPF